MEILRRELVDQIQERLRTYPVVALLGMRQVGKTTVALQVGDRWTGPVHRFDLEHPRHRARLQDPLLALEDLEGLVVLDEIQHQPEIFPVLRVLADRPGTPARFLVLGSASPELLRQSSETLAGRISFLEITGFATSEVSPESWNQLWLRGSFPPAYLASSSRASLRWREDFISTFLERDLPNLGSRVSAPALRRFWSMLAHLHGQVMNYSRLGRSLDVTDMTVRRHLDLLVSTFAVRRLAPWSENLGKRQVKSPKFYLADSGLLHALLGLETEDELQGHPSVGASWEGFALAEVVSQLRVRWQDCYFWGTHAGAELDLLVVRGSRRLGFEFKLTSSPRVTRSMRQALDDLGLESLTVVYPGSDSFPLGERVSALGLASLADLAPL